MRSFGMLTARAFCRARRSAGLASGLDPDALTAIAMSLPTLVNSLPTRSIRLKMVALRFSKARPMAGANLATGRGVVEDEEPPVDTLVRVGVGVVPDLLERLGGNLDEPGLGVGHRD